MRYSKRKARTENNKRTRNRRISRAKRSLKNTKRITETRNGNRKYRKTRDRKNSERIL